MSSVLIFEILALDIHNELLAVSLWRFKGSELSTKVIRYHCFATYPIHNNYDIQSTRDLIIFPPDLG